MTFAFDNVSYFVIFLILCSKTQQFLLVGVKNLFCLGRRILISPLLGEALSEEGNV